MKLSLFSDYSLRVLIYASLRDGLFQLQDVSKAYGISRNHLAQVVHRLGQLGYLETRRGRGGGCRLARPAERISVGEVVKFGEEGQPLVECFDPERNRCVITPACKLKGMISEAKRAFFDVLGKYTIADVCAKPEALLRHLGLTAP